MSLFQNEAEYLDVKRHEQKYMSRLGELNRQKIGQEEKGELTLHTVVNN